jgi:superfamily II DNA/RNA helicase
LSKQAEENGFSQADRMLDMGFIDTVKALIGKMPKARSAWSAQCKMCKGKEMTSGNIRGMIIDEMRNLRMIIQ